MSGYGHSVRAEAKYIGQFIGHIEGAKIETFSLKSFYRKFRIERFAYRRNGILNSLEEINKFRFFIYNLIR